MATARLDVCDDFQWDDRAPRLLTVNNEDEEGSDTEEKETRRKKNARKSKETAMVQDKHLEQRMSMIRDFNPNVPMFQELESLYDCEQLVQAHPDSSRAWMSYIVFYLKQAEIDKARNVAEKALKMMCFREEKEKLNMWIVLLNLENLYGSEESLLHAFERALVQNDPKYIYSHLADLYVNSQKKEEAEEILETMVKKFKHDFDIWIKYITFYMKSGKPELAKKVMDRSFRTLDKKCHADVMGKLALLEFECGELEKCKALFENIAQNYPKRKDLLSIYMSILNKIGNKTEVERLSTVLQKR